MGTIASVAKSRLHSAIEVGYGMQRLLLEFLPEMRKTILYSSGAMYKNCFFPFRTQSGRAAEKGTSKK